MANSSSKKVKNVSPKKVKVAKPKVNKKRLLKSLEDICSQLCSINATGMCEICGKVGTQAHHVFSKKSFPSLRYNLDNLIWLCFFCHIRRTHQQGQYELVRDAMIKRLGVEGFDSLKELAYKKYTGLKRVSINMLIDLEKNLSTILQNASHSKKSFILYPH